MIALKQLAWPAHLRPILRRRVIMSDRCELTCLGCELSPRGFSEQRIVDRLALLKPSWMGDIQVDIGGGDPLLFPDRIAVIVQNRHRGVKLNLWTHGTSDWSPILPLLPQIDHVFLFAPQLTREEYREATGMDRFDQLADAIALLKDNQKSVTLVQVVNENDINHLADDYEWVLAHNLEWLLMAENEAISSQDGVAYLRRFEGIPRCYVKLNVPIRVGRCQGGF